MLNIPANNSGHIEVSPTFMGLVLTVRISWHPKSASNITTRQSLKRQVLGSISAVSAKLCSLVRHILLHNSDRYPGSDHSMSCMYIVYRHPIGSSYSMYIDECACTTKTSSLSDGLCREISSKPEL